ncbi:hypothetical protein GS921_25505 [Rhodococcus hoagii]|nr:hypothetical protein [Prescottella equi]
MRASLRGGGDTALQGEFDEDQLDEDLQAVDGVGAVREFARGQRHESRHLTFGPGQQQCGPVGEVVYTAVRATPARSAIVCSLRSCQGLWCSSTANAVEHCVTLAALCSASVVHCHVWASAVFLVRGRGVVDEQFGHDPRVTCHVRQPIEDEDGRHALEGRGDGSI